MSLPILLILVVAGISGIVGLVHLLGFSRARPFAGEAEVRAVLERHLSCLTPREITLTDDRLAAVATTDGPPAIAARIGNGALARPLGEGTIRKIEEQPDRLVIHLTDYTAPSVVLVASDPEQRAYLRQLLEGRP